MIDLKDRNARCRIDLDEITPQLPWKLLNLLYADPVSIDSQGRRTGAASGVLYQSTAILRQLQQVGVKEEYINLLHYLVLNALYSGIELGREFPATQKEQEPMEPKTKERIEFGVSEYKEHIQAAHDIIDSMIDSIPEFNTKDTVIIWLILKGLLKDIDEINTKFWNIKEKKTIDLDIYLPTIRCISNSILDKKEIYFNYDKITNPSILKAFIDDNNVQEITTTSVDIGVNRTYRKFYKREEEWVNNRIKELKEEEEACK